MHTTDKLFLAEELVPGTFRNSTGSREDHGRVIIQDRCDKIVLRGDITVFPQSLVDALSTGHMSVISGYATMPEEHLPEEAVECHESPGTAGPLGQGQ